MRSTDMRTRRAELAGLAALGVLVMTSGAAADDPGALVKTRVGHFKDIGRAAHVVQIEVSKPAADPAAVADAARKIQGLADEIPSWFPPGTGPDTGVATQARAEIWSDPAGFAAKAAALRGSAQALENAAAVRDQIAIKTGFANLAQACQSCHSVYRTGEH